MTENLSRSLDSKLYATKKRVRLWRKGSKRHVETVEDEPCNYANDGSDEYVFVLHLQVTKCHVLIQAALPAFDLKTWQWPGIISIFSWSDSNIICRFRWQKPSEERKEN